MSDMKQELETWVIPFEGSHVFLFGVGLEDFVELVFFVTSGSDDRLVVRKLEAALDVSVLSHSRKHPDVAAQLL